jgi:hypothetical protein
MTWQKQHKQWTHGKGSEYYNPDFKGFFKLFRDGIATGKVLTKEEAIKDLSTEDTKEIKESYAEGIPAIAVLGDKYFKTEKESKIYLDKALKTKSLKELKEVV